MKTADKGSGSTGSDKPVCSNTVYSHYMHLLRLGVEVGHEMFHTDMDNTRNLYL